ncbi:YbfB/YjiJ family MFS transporter [Arachidicoccus sp.]|uniref:YbfB/YjiJ family MFS transporter n=1 Tax=Arachidicoccus sp. TaxID=1872624 RepID=UPI003D22B92D
MRYPSKGSTGFMPAFTGLVTLLIANGIGRFGYPPLIPALINHRWFSVSQADYLGAANLTGYIAGSMLATYFNRFIPSVTLIRIALALLILTFALCAIPLDFKIYFLLRFVAGATGGILMITTAPTIFKHTVSKSKGLISGIIFSGVGIGIALAGTIIPVLVRRSITITWLTFAGTSLLLIAIVWRGWPAGSNEKHLPPNLEKHPSHRGHLFPRAALFLLISYVCAAVGFAPHTIFWVDFISRGLGKGIQTGTKFWVLLGLAAAIGPIIAGFMADKIGFKKSISISLLVMATGVCLPVFCTANWSLGLSSVFLGSQALGLVSLTAGRSVELVRSEYQKKLWSWMTIGFSLVYAGMAYLSTYLFSVFHSYQMLFAIGTIALVFGAMLSFIDTDKKLK